jgi:2-methylcitrate dehydratase PrpD
MTEALSSLARFAARTDARTLPAQIVLKAKACLLYGVAVGIACMHTRQPAQAVQAFADGDGAIANGEHARGRATRFFDGATCDARPAAFANGTLFHARVQDDAHPAGHVGVVVIPAALAMAEATLASGADLLAALVSGYETSLRIGRDHAADLSARGFRTTPAYGVFGAAASAGRLLGFDAHTMTHALGLAANMAGGLREFAAAGSEDFAFQAGAAAANGITAARLAAAGAASSPSVLEGEAGFYRAFGENGRRYDARLAAGLGTEFEIMGITYKPYPICQFHRGIVRGCLKLRERANGAPLASLTVRMHPFEADFFGVRFAGPFRVFPQTFMSAPFCASLAWARGGATLAGLTDFQAADVLDLVSRVSVVSDSERARYSPRLEARLSNNSRLEWEETERAEAYQLTWDTARSMTAILSSEVGVPAAAARRLVSEVEHLDGARDLEPFLDAVRETCNGVRS